MSRKRSDEEIVAEIAQLEYALSLAGTQSERVPLMKRLWKLRNIEKTRIAAREWQQTHPNHWREYEQQHPDMIKRNRHQTYLRRKARLATYWQEWRDRNRSRLRQQNRANYQKRKARRRNAIREKLARES